MHVCFCLHAHTCVLCVRVCVCVCVCKVWWVPNVDERVCIGSQKALLCVYTTCIFEEWSGAEGWRRVEQSINANGSNAFTYTGILIKLFS
jgi:hypothetical protein